MVVRLDPRTVVELLQRLERQHAEHRPHLADVAMAINKSDYEQAAAATGNLHSVLESIIVTRARLREYVISVDSLGEPASLIELAIRARRVVITMQADRLRDAFSGSGVVPRTRGWFVGKFRKIDEVIVFLGELTKSTCSWERYREGQPLLAGMKEADRSMMYRTTVRIAQRTMHELGSDPDLLHFLRCGIEATDWLDAYAGCKQIATALAGEIDVESDTSVVAQLPRKRMSDTSAETP
jgi:hypothetical protein